MDVSKSIFKSSQQREEISSLHNALVKDLSQVFSPQHPTWQSLLELLSPTLDPDELFGERVTDFSDICKSLIAKGEITQGSYEPLFEVINKIDVKAAEIITKATEDIQSVIAGGPSPVKRQRKDEDDQSDSETMIQSLTLDQVQGYSPRIEEAIEATKTTVEAQTGKPEIISTQALEDAKEKLRENSVVVIRGASGDGKTLMCHQLLKWLMDDKGRDDGLVKQPLQLHHSLEDLGEEIEPDSQLAFFLDDISENIVEELKVRDDSIQSMFSGKLYSKSNCLLLNIRDEVFNSTDLSSCKLFSTKNIINLRSQNCMTRQEKLLILDKYTPESQIWSDNEKSEIIDCAKDLGFPQSCRLYRDIPHLQNLGVDFFKKPFESMQEVLNQLSDECKSALLFLFLNSGGVKRDHLEPNRGAIDRKKLDIAFSGTEVSHGDKMRSLRKSLKEMSGSFVSTLKYWIYDDNVDDNDETEYYQFCQLPPKPTDIFGRVYEYDVYGDEGNDDVDDDLDSDDLYRYDDPHLVDSNQDSEEDSEDADSNHPGYADYNRWGDSDYNQSGDSDSNHSGDSDSNHSDDSDSKHSNDSDSDDEEFYTLSHDFIQNAVAIWYGNTTKTGFIENSPGKSLQYLSTLNCVTTSSRSLNRVVVSPDEYIYVFPRLLRELECKKAYHIDSLDVWSDRQFLERFLRWANDENVDKLALLKNACSSGALKCGLHLLSVGVNPDVDTPIWSLIRGDVDVLRKCFIYVNEDTKVSLLNEACSSGAEECALSVLAMGVRPSRDTPLWSLIKGDVEMLRKVVKYQTDEVKVGLLNDACYNGSDECSFYLLSVDVKPNEETPFCLVHGGSVKVFQSLLQYDVMSKARSEMTKCSYMAANINVLHEACLREREEMVSMVCDIYPHLALDPDKYGQTALHLAALAGNYSIFRRVESIVLKSLHSGVDEEPKCESVNGLVVHRTCVCARYMNQLLALLDWTVLHYSCMSGRSKEVCLYLCRSYPALTALVDKHDFHCLHHLVRCKIDVDWFTQCETHVKQYLESKGEKYDITAIKTAEGESILDLTRQWGTFMHSNSDPWQFELHDHLARIWQEAASANT